MITLHNIQNLTLYHYESCPYCHVVRQAIDKTGLNIELRDILKNEQYLKELLTDGGKIQVPALRLECHTGDVEWLYESQDIINFLHEYFSLLAQTA